MPELLTQAQAHEFLGVGRHFFVKQVRPHVKYTFVGGDRRYGRRDLERWVDRTLRVV